VLVTSRWVGSFAMKFQESFANKHKKTTTKITHTNRIFSLYKTLLHNPLTCKTNFRMKNGTQIATTIIFIQNVQQEE
jgi:hypothetical protein